MGITVKHSVFFELSETTIPNIVTQYKIIISKDL